MSAHDRPVAYDPLDDGTLDSFGIAKGQQGILL